MQLQKKKANILFVKRLQKNITKKKLIILLKSTKKLKFLAILKIYLQLSTKVFYKNLINNNNKDIIELIDNKISNNLIELSTSFKDIRCKLFINKRISVEI